MHYLKNPAISDERGFILRNTYDLTIFVDFERYASQRLQWISGDHLVSRASIYGVIGAMNLNFG